MTNAELADRVMTDWAIGYPGTLASLVKQALDEAAEKALKEYADTWLQGESNDLETFGLIWVKPEGKKRATEFHRDFLRLKHRPKHEHKFRCECGEVK